MTKTGLNQLAKKVRNELQYEGNKGTIADVERLLRCFIGGSYDSMFTTKLYCKQGGAYCLYLELLNDRYIHLREK